MSVQSTINWIQLHPPLSVAAISPFSVSAPRCCKHPWLEAGALTARAFSRMFAASYCHELPTPTPETKLTNPTATEWLTVLNITESLFPTRIMSVSITGSNYIYCWSRQMTVSISTWCVRWKSEIFKFVVKWTVSRLVNILHSQLCCHGAGRGVFTLLRVEEHHPNKALTSLNYYSLLMIVIIRFQATIRAIT